MLFPKNKCGAPAALQQSGAVGPSGRTFLALVLLTLSFTSASAQQYGRDLRNRPIAALGDDTDHAVVLYFVASDCPISNRTFPEMRRVREQFAPQGVRFWFVYANAGELPDAVRTHQRSFDPNADPTLNTILDTTGELARLAHATVTPEVAILRPQPGPALLAPRFTAAYTGRIDNRYVKLGVERPQATEHYAERVLQQILTGKPVEKPTGNLIGCGIVTPSPAKAAP